MRNFVFGVVTLLLLPFCNGCSRQTVHLNELEVEAAGTLQRWLEVHAINNPGKEPTNTAEVLSMMNLSRWHRSHPAFFQIEFRRFGKYAGFTNSFYEKYVSVPAFFTNRAVHGPAVFMSSQPYPNLEGKMVWMVIWKAGPQDYERSVVPDNEVQEVFRKAGVPIPQPLPMPIPRPPPGDLPKESFNAHRVWRDLVADYYAPRRFWSIVAICLLTALTLGFLILLAFRRVR